jgi:hypothetical protein
MWLATGPVVGRLAFCFSICSDWLSRASCTRDNLSQIRPCTRERPQFPGSGRAGGRHLRYGPVTWLRHWRGTMPLHGRGRYPRPPAPDRTSAFGRLTPATAVPRRRHSSRHCLGEMAPLSAAGRMTSTPGAVAIPRGIPRGIPYPHAVSARKRENNLSFHMLSEASKGRYQPRLRPQGGCPLDCPSGSLLFIVPFQVRDSPTTTTAPGLRPISIAWRVVEQEPSLHIRRTVRGRDSKRILQDRGRSAPPRLGNPDRRPETFFDALTIREARSRPRSVRGRSRESSFHAPTIFRAFCERNLHFSNCRLEFLKIWRIEVFAEFQFFLFFASLPRFRG